MSAVISHRPASTEYAPYYERYVSLVLDDDIVPILNRQVESSVLLLRSIPESQAGSRYAPGKWSIKELVGHMVDCERIFGYRALTFARNDATPIPGFEQDDYVAAAEFDRYPLSELTTEFEYLRRSNVQLFKHLDADAWTRKGVANGNAVSVRALAYIMAGHEAHHMGVLRERYLETSELIR